MNKIRLLTIYMIVLSILMLICSIDDFLSLHDIKKDYISKAALQYLETSTSKELPSWTNTTLEWRSVQISYLIRLVSMLTILCMTIYIRTDMKKMI